MGSGELRLHLHTYDTRRTGLLVGVSGRHALGWTGGWWAVIILTGSNYCNERNRTHDGRAAAHSRVGEGAEVGFHFYVLYLLLGLAFGEGKEMREES